jgi:Na+/proline symporter
MNANPGLTTLDILILVAYLVGIAALGIYAVRRVKGTHEFFIGDRRFGKALMMA